MFSLNEVVPWGRSYDEYRRMFLLSDDDLCLRILGCGDGPASFNAEATRRGAQVVSCDPLYRFGRSEIRKRIDETRATVLEQTRQNQQEFVWNEIRSVDELGRIRMAAMIEFLADYDAGRRHGRYIDAELPALPFSDEAFDLAVCSHFLFLYTTQLGEEFHRKAVRELGRVAREVRIFPLLALGGTKSQLVEQAIDEFQHCGLQARAELVPYEFQRGGNEMLRALKGSSDAGGRS